MPAGSSSPVVLIADDSPAWRRLWRSMLFTCECRLIEAATAAKVIELVAAEAPRLVLLDLHFDDKPAGPDLCQAVRDAAPPGMPVDILAISGRLEGAGHLQVMLESGASWYLDKLESPGVFRRAVEIILRPAAPAASPGAGPGAHPVLLVQSDEELLDRWAAQFGEHGFAPYCAQSAQEAFLSLAKVRPRALVLGPGLPDLSPTSVASILRARRSTRGLPVVLATPEESARGGSLPLRVKRAIDARLTA